MGNGYSPSGAPYRGGSSFLLDGANIIDPGCNCNSIAVPNPDMTAEVKVENTFGADSPNGPQVINSTSKSGGKGYHGQAYFYARNQVLNSNDWSNNHQGSPKQPGQYYYPGGNIGGPIPIPHYQNKLFFWAGYEYYKQTLPAGTPLESYIPSAGMMAGNFTMSGQGNSALCTGGFSNAANNWCADPTGYNDAHGNPINPAAVPVDPGAVALMKMFPAANANPATTPGNYNYVLPYSNVQNGYVWRGRVDYNINENNKVFVTYQQGFTNQITVAHMWWNPSNDVAYPGGSLTSPVTARVMTANMVNVIRPTLTNEFVFGWGYGNFPFKPSGLSAIYKSTLGYTYPTVWSSASPIVPSINSAGAQTFPDISQPGLWNAQGEYALRKEIPSFADNVTKVWHTHTFKFGGFTELVGNDQGAWSYANGVFGFGSGANPDTLAGTHVLPGTQIGSNNPTANLVMGIANSFQQNNFAPTQDVAFRTTSGYLMDTWRVAQRLTVNAGMRFDHLGRWYDRQGVGMAVWYPQLYAQDVAINQAAGSMVVEYPGIRWKGLDSGIPNGGSPTRLAWATPRVGFSYDVQGNGQTVVRGGWGEYAWNDQGPGALTTSQNMQTYNVPSGQAITFDQVGQQQPSGNPMPAGSVTAEPFDDYQNSLTYSWNLTVDRQLPWKSMIEIAYVGNSSHHLLMGGQSDAVGIGGSGFSNVNKIPLGGLFRPDPVTGAAAPTDPENNNTFDIKDYEPYSGCVNPNTCYGYGTNSVTVPYHLGIANYNGLQIAWLKQGTHASWNFNYTWSKTLGLAPTTLDAFNMRNNYGIDNDDRPQVFNSSYSYSFGTLYHGGEKLIGGVTNGWTISGITIFQTGGNLQPETSYNLGLNISELSGAGNNVSGGKETLSTKTWFGTDQGTILPITTCNPKAGLQAHQLIKFSCFAAPQLGQQGNRVQHPYLSGPIYNNSDLTLYKTFHVTERQNVEFRASAFDFMNHPLWGSTGGNLLSLQYQTTDGGHTYNSSPTSVNVPLSAPCSTAPNVQVGWGCMNQKSPYSGAGYDRIIEVSAKYNF